MLFFKKRYENTSYLFVVLMVCICVLLIKDKIRRVGAVCILLNSSRPALWLWRKKGQNRPGPEAWLFSGVMRAVRTFPWLSALQFLHSTNSPPDPRGWSWELWQLTCLQISSHLPRVFFSSYSWQGNVSRPASLVERPSHTKLYDAEASRTQWSASGPLPSVRSHDKSEKKEKNNFR